MQVFVLRHGVTEDGEADVHQHGESVLSIEGINQAKQIAANFSTLNLDRIYTSPDQRARQTAAIISSHMADPIEVISHQDLHEMRKPDLYIGKSHHDPEVKRQKDEMKKNITPDFRLPGGENVFDVKDRVDRVLEELEKCFYKRVLVITHSAVIRVMILSLYSKKENVPFEIMARLYPVIRAGLDVDNGRGFEISLDTIHNPALPTLEPGRLHWDFSFTALPETHLVSWRPPPPEDEEE